MSDEIFCPVCFRHCRLKAGQTGFCRARKNEGGKSVSISYGKVTSLALDPIEKKPLAWFYPGTLILSAGSFGCNLDCPFCQNHAISRAGEDGADFREIQPDELAALAKEYRDRGSIGMAFTYNEPTVGYEFVRDTAREVKKLGLRNVVVTNGSAEESVLAEFLPFTDAFNIDLKCFSEEGYQKLGGELQTVLRFICAARAAAHVELTALIVPFFNDSDDEMAALSEWVASVDPEMPLHITRFFPRYRWADVSPTPVSTLYRLEAIAKRKLKRVKIGNI